MTRFTLNGRPVEFQGDDQMPLLWYLRDHAALTGTKFGCGVGLCGACTVHLDGQAVRSCALPLASVGGRRVTTIEGLGGAELHAVQRAWIEEDVAQCGYCQAGQIMRATALLEQTPRPTDADIDAAMAANLCRCGTYVRIRRAIHSAVAKITKAGGAA
jgi:isoquinoline 1-oxidoreductase alpha subunit